MHPGFDIGETGGEGGVGGWSDGFGGKVELSVVGKAMKTEAMAAEDLAEGEHVQDEKEGAEYRTLGDTVSEWGSGGFAVVDGNVLVTVGKVGSEPGEDGASDASVVLKAGKEDGVVDGVESCSEVEKDENGEGAGVCREEYVVGDFEKGGFGTVF